MRTAENIKLKEFFETRVPKFSPTFYLPLPFNKMAVSMRKSDWILKNYRRKTFVYPDGGQTALEFYPKTLVHPVEKKLIESEKKSKDENKEPKGKKVLKKLFPNIFIKILWFVKSKKIKLTI